MPIQELEEPLYRRQLRSIGVAEKVLDETDQQYRALGRFHYQFSCIIRTAWMFTTMGVDTYVPGTPKHKIRTTLESRTAGPGMKALFKYCRDSYSHNANEQQVHDWFVDQFEMFNNIRNDIAHGIAFLGYGDPQIEGDMQMSIGRLRPNAEVSSNYSLNSPSSIDFLSDDVWYYRRQLSEYTSLLAWSMHESMPPGIIETNLRMSNGRVERTRPITTVQELLTGG